MSFIIIFVNPHPDSKKLIYADSLNPLDISIPEEPGMTIRYREWRENLIDRQICDELTIDIPDRIRLKDFRVNVNKQGKIAEKTGIHFRNRLRCMRLQLVYICNINFDYFMERIFAEIRKSAHKERKIYRYMEAINKASDYFMCHYPYLKRILNIMRKKPIISRLLITVLERFYSFTLVENFFKGNDKNLYYCINLLQTLKYDFFNLWKQNSKPDPANLKRMFREADAVTLTMEAKLFKRCCNLIVYGVKNPTYFDFHSEKNNRDLASRLLKGLMIEVAYSYPSFPGSRVRYRESWMSVQRYDASDVKICYCRRGFLAFQVAFLYFSKDTKQYHHACQKLLVTLWESMSDPLLTMDDFKHNLDYCSYNESLVSNVFTWYVEQVWGDETPRSRPRSLRHLSRVAIRDRLAECFSLPCFVAYLPLPDKLKQYILLEKVIF